MMAAAMVVLLMAVAAVSPEILLRGFFRRQRRTGPAWPDDWREQLGPLRRPLVLSGFALSALTGLDWAYGPMLAAPLDLRRFEDAGYAVAGSIIVLNLAVRWIRHARGRPAPRFRAELTRRGAVHYALTLLLGFALLNVSPWLDPRYRHQSFPPDLVLIARVLDAAFLCMLALIMVSGILSLLSIGGIRVQSRPVGEGSDYVELAVTKEGWFPACCIKVSIGGKGGLASAPFMVRPGATHVVRCAAGAAPRTDGHLVRITTEFPFGFYRKSREYLAGSPAG